MIDIFVILTYLMHMDDMTKLIQALTENARAPFFGAPTWDCALVQSRIERLEKTIRFMPIAQ